MLINEINENYFELIDYLNFLKNNPNAILHYDYIGN